MLGFYHSASSRITRVIYPAMIYPMNFVTGDKVEHKSGAGPAMIVVAIDPEGIACTWLAQDGRYKTHIFAATSLQPHVNGPLGSTMVTARQAQRTAHRSIG